MSQVKLDCQAAWSPSDGWLFVLNRRISISEFYALAKSEYENIHNLWNLLPEEHPQKVEYAHALEDLQNKRIRQHINPEATINVFEPFLQ